VALGQRRACAVTCPDGLVTSAPTFCIDGMPSVGAELAASARGHGQRTEYPRIGRRDDGAVRMVGTCEVLMIW
jgi:hypothetical protein